MPVRIVVGAQWGDEGKGKVVDYLGEKADIIARYAGGPNAGHTVVAEGRTFILHLVPSGVLRSEKICVIGNGVVLNPETFFEEIAMLKAGGLTVENRLFVSERAHIITRYHLAIEGIEEDSVEGGRIGTTRRGIGPAYRDKVGRIGIRVADLVTGGDIQDRVRLMREEVLAAAAGRTIDLPDAESEIRRLRAFGEALAPLACDVSTLLGDALRGGKDILAEGAQGTLLDVDFGTYPFVTSSNPIAGGACVGLGIGPTDVAEVIGITKAYTTRVGRGPFPTELPREEAEALREAGEEYGATTGRPRRCGWLDAVALRHSVRVNGLTALAVTKLDVLDELDELSVCVRYELDGRTVEYFPPTTSQLERCVPVYEAVPGWKRQISEARTLSALPERAKEYLDFISKLSGVPVVMASVGSGREQTISLKS